MFSRKKENGKDKDRDNSKDKAGGWRRPANTAFKQQRLKAWQPILTPKTVLPTLFLIALVFGPIGGALVWGSSLVSQITIDYTQCDSLPAVTSPDQLASPSAFTSLSNDKFSYNLRSKDAHKSPSYAPRLAFLDNSGNQSVTDVSQKKECYVQFNLPADLEHSVFIYYRLDNFFQNHRRYVKSFNSDQLKGNAVSASSLNGSDCSPLGSIGGQAIYPCGLIANSIFNDTIGNATLQNPPGGGDATVYEFSANGIAWPGESKKYVSTPLKSDANPKGYADVSQIVPPPNWHDRYPNGYTTDNVPNLQNDFHFQNWMRTAGLPTFSKLYGRNDNQDMLAGDYQIIIGMNFPVTPYKGSKAIVISTVSWIGGKNPFLGWAYVGAAGLFVLLAIVGTARHLIKPRRLGDMSLLSWNR